MSDRRKTEYLRPESALLRYLMLPRFLLYTIRDLSAAMRRSESAVKVALRARGGGADIPRAAGSRQDEPAVSPKPG